MPVERGRLRFSVENGDIRAAKADLVALKYAEGLYGADLAVALELLEAGVLPDLDAIGPDPGDVQLVETKGAISAPLAVFIGTPALLRIGYDHLRELARTAVSVADKHGASHLALTIHGPGFGMDDIEAFLAEFAGCNEAVWQKASSVDQVTFVEIERRRAERLFAALQAALAGRDDVAPAPGIAGERAAGTEGALDVSIPPARDRDARLAQLPGTTSETKKQVFVAMPFAAKHYDTYHYGIQRPVRKKGFVCERVDEEHFTGDVLERVKKKIEEAAVVIGFLADANPNVFLEIGYAWGKGRPTVLLAPSKTKLRFDVQSQRCVTYKSIHDLEDALSAELQGLLDAGVI